jgi:hypothetical protein
MDKLAAAFGAALILAGLPTFVRAADAQAVPISIESVQVFAATTEPEQPYQPGIANITFRNEYGAPATEVVFALECKGDIVDRFDDIGSFSTGVAINHNFAYGQTLVDVDSNVTVAVAEARFADGTVWDNPAVPDAPAAPTPVGVPATVDY